MCSELRGVDELRVVHVEQHWYVKQTPQDGPPKEADPVPTEDRSDGPEGATVQLRCAVAALLRVPDEHPREPALALGWRDRLERK